MGIETAYAPWVVDMMKRILCVCVCVVRFWERFINCIERSKKEISEKPV